MYNVLIIEKSLSNAEKVVNTLSQEQNYIRIANISSNYNEAIKYILSKKFEIIILNSAFLEVLTYIEKRKLYNYQQNIIVLAENKNTINKTNNSRLKTEIIGYNQLGKTISKLLKHKNSSILIRNKIRKELSHLNFNYGYVGTKYIEDTIFEIYRMKENFNGNLKQEIYPILAKRYNKSIDTIYANIKQATKCMLLDCSQETIMNYFKYSVSVLPKAKEIILTVLNRI